MSSLSVRTAIKSFLSSNASGESVVDLSGDFQDFKQLLTEAGVQPDAPWLGLEFIGDDEIPIALAATNVQGKYREFGSIHLHICDVAKIGCGDAILTRGETLRDLFRGSRIGSILIESVTPLNFGRGATLDFDGGFMSASFLVAYQKDIDL